MQAPSHFKQMPKDHNQGSSLPSASPSHFKQRPFHHNQGSAHQASNGPRRSKWPNFTSLNIWFATSWLNLKFVCLFHISIFLWILKIHVPFDVLCSCIYFFKKIQKKNSRFPNLSQKKRKIFKKKKRKGL